MTRMLDAYGLNQGKVWEGLPGTNGQPALKAYLDSAGVPTIGFGHTKNVKIGDVITPERAEQDLQDDLAPTCAAVEDCVKAPLTNNQFAALVWFAFNVGVGAFKASTLVKNLNMTPPNYDSVPEQLAQWKFVTDPATGKKIVSKGLVNRRALETTLWLLPDEAMKPLESSPALPTTATLTQSDLRQVTVTTATPVAPPTSASQTRTGQGALAGIVTGAGGAIIEGAQQAQHITNAIGGALSGSATSSQWFMVVSALLAVAAIGSSVYIYWRTHKTMAGAGK
ncbi:lysozyme [Rhodanobacter sp. BL-MT-08]